MAADGFLGQAERTGDLSQRLTLRRVPQDGELPSRKSGA
jgi:hypothetical protein